MRMTERARLAAVFFVILCMAGGPAWASSPVESKNGMVAAAWAAKATATAAMPPSAAATSSRFAMPTSARSTRRASNSRRPGAVRQPLGQQPFIGSFGTRVSGITARCQPAQRKSRLQRDHRIAFFDRQLAAAIGQGGFFSQCPGSVGLLLAEEVFCALTHRGVRVVEAPIAQACQGEGGHQGAAAGAPSHRQRSGSPGTVGFLLCQQVGHLRIMRTQLVQLCQLRVIRGAPVQVAQHQGAQAGGGICQE